MNEKPNVAKSLIKQVIKENPELTLGDYQEMVNRPERTVAYWLSGERAPDDMALYLIRVGLRNGRCAVPNELNSYVKALNLPARKWGAKYAEKKGNNKEDRRFIYHGEMLTVAQIKEKSERPSAEVRRLYNYPYGKDVTQIIDNPKNNVKPTIAVDTYIYKGEELSIRAIADITGLSQHFVYQRTRGFPLNSDVTDAVNRKKKIREKGQKTRKYLYNGELLSIGQISKKTGIPYQSCSYHITSNGIKEGEEANAVLDKYGQTRPIRNSNE